MPNLEAGTVVATVACPECGGKNRVKLNKNGIAYFYCVHADDYGERCNHQVRYSRKKSQALQREYLDDRKAKKKAKPDAPKPEPTADVQDKSDGAEKDWYDELYG